VLIYTVDCTLRDEAAVLTRLAGDRNISPTPDMAYKFVAQAPAGLQERPIVIGMGPCGFWPPCCWPRWAFARSCWSAARSCASAPRTPGACGARTR
jgi:hypothetical protein